MLKEICTVMMFFRWVIADWAEEVMMLRVEYMLKEMCSVMMVFVE